MYKHHFYKKGWWSSATIVFCVKFYENMCDTSSRWQRTMWMALTIQNMLIFFCYMINFRGHWLLPRYYTEKKEQVVLWEILRNKKVVLKSVMFGFFMYPVWGLLVLLCMFSLEVWFRELKNSDRIGTNLQQISGTFLCLFVRLFLLSWWLDYCSLWETVVWRFSECSCINYKIQQVHIQY